MAPGLGHAVRPDDCPVEAERLAEAPFAAGMTAKVTMPPATGSSDSLTVTVIASGFASGAGRPRSASGCRQPASE